MPRETMAAKRERAAEIEKRMFDHYGAGACSLDYECDPFRLPMLLSIKLPRRFLQHTLPQQLLLRQTSLLLQLSSIHSAFFEQKQRILYISHKFL